MISLLNNMTKIESHIKSPMNYTIGNGKILSQLLPLFLLNISTFVDLFYGGCNCNFTKQ